jgi:Asp-tRNA(Asn)/Glu-tRNA(Gln) amidotransferase A subunit family amidase
VNELCFTPATELADKIASRELSPVELMDAVLDRIEEQQPRVNAFCLLRAHEAREEARAAQDAEPRGPLHGIPISIKDLTSTKGIRTTFGSKAYAGNVPDVDATFVTRLREAGAIVLGKTNTPEFGNKGVTDSPLNGTTANPWSLDRTAGGSSGGAAAAVAAGLGPLAEGSDGAGSIRIPASFCGVVGFKPSFGRVPMYPRNGYHTISHHGPLARTVADAALMLSVMAGPDQRDPHIRNEPPADYRAAVQHPEIEGWTIGFSPDFGHLPVEPEVAEIVAHAVGAFEDLGANVEQAPALPDAREPMAVIWRVVFEAIVREQIAPHIGPDEMDPHLRELAAEGVRIDAATYYDAVSLFRIAFFHEMEKLFGRHRLLVSPTLAVAPFPHPEHGRPGPETVAGEAVNPFLGWLLTYHFNLTGQPAISIPCGFTEDGLPVGLQIAGRPGADEDVLRAAAAFEASASRTTPNPP